MNERDLDAGFHAIKSERTAYPNVADVHAQLLAIPIERIPQQRRWLPPFATWRPQSMFSATKFVVAGVIVATFGGFLLTGVLMTQSQDEMPVVGASALPEASSLAPLMLPTELPEGIRSGTLETPLGPARWVHLQREGSNLPRFNEDGWGHGDVRQGENDAIISAADGYATLGESDAVLWLSPDLVTWESHQLPVLAGEMGLSWTDGSYWLATADPGGLWRTTDGTDWQEVSLSALEPPDVPGLEWEAMVGTPTTSSATTLVPVAYAAQNTREYLGLPAKPRRSSDAALRASGRGVYTASGFGSQEYDLAELRFEEFGNGLRVIDVQDGTTYTELDGVDMDFIDAWAAHEPLGYLLPNLVATKLGVVEGNALVPAGQPVSPFTAATFFGSGAGLVTYVTDTPDDLIRVWHSVDGTAWTQGETLGDDPDEPISGEQVRFDFGPDRVEVVDYGGDRGWTSIDGLTWSAYDGITWTQDDYDRGHDAPVMSRPPLSEVELTRIPQGFLSLLADGSTDARTPVHSLVFHLDGQDGSTAVDVTDVGMEMENGAGGLDPISGNTVMLSQGYGAPRDEGLWFITFDNLPA